MLAKSRNDVWIRRFVLSVGVILLFTALAKISGGYGSAKILSTIDPILGVSFRHLMLFAGAVELFISGICLFTQWTRTSLILTAWLASMFIIYKSGIIYIHWHKSCPCLGNLTDALKIPPDLAAACMTAIATYLLVGSIFCWLCLKAGTDNFTGTQINEI